MLLQTSGHTAATGTKTKRAIAACGWRSTWPCCSEEARRPRRRHRRRRPTTTPPLRALDEPGRSTSAAAAAPPPLPTVDWSRHHLQLLIVDATDTLRARLAASMLERVAEWNGYSRALAPFTAGVHAEPGPLAGLAARAGLMARAAALGVPPKAFGRAAEAFELSDLDRFDVVVCVDSATRDAVLARVAPEHRADYAAQVRLLSEYASDPALLATDALLATGGLALLPRRLSAQLGPPEALAALRAVVDTPRPSLLVDTSAAGSARGGGADEWALMVRVTLLGCAGLVNYLIAASKGDPGWEEL